MLEVLGPSVEPAKDISQKLTIPSKIAGSVGDGGPQGGS